MINYSQNQEQEIILSYFNGKKGRFVEIGAYDPFLFSNTRALVELDWSGIYVEANERHLQKFQALYQNNTGIECIYGALSTTSEDVIFYECMDALSTTDLNHKAKWEKGGTQFEEAKKVPAYSIQELTEKTSGYDFLTLDTEGTSYELFSWLPDEYLQSLSLICVEHDNKAKDINNRLSILGFKNLLLNGENVIYGK